MAPQLAEQTKSGLDSYIELTQAVGQAVDHVSENFTNGVFDPCVPLGLWLDKYGAIVDHKTPGGAALVLMAIPGQTLNAMGAEAPTRRGRPAGRAQSTTKRGGRRTTTTSRARRSTAT